jgi:hypothetical protein
MNTTTTTTTYTTSHLVEIQGLAGKPVFFSKLVSFKNVTYT